MNNIKDKWKYRDQLLNSVSSDGYFRISIVKATNVIIVAKEKHNLSPLTTLILGRLLLGTILATSSLKGEERITFRVESNGPVSNIVSEANALGEIRGYISNPQYMPTDLKAKDVIKESIGRGVLYSSKVLYGKRKPHLSSVPLVFSEITEDLNYYYTQSVQIQTVLKIYIGFNKDMSSISQAYGLMVQAMPNTSEKKKEEMAVFLAGLPLLSSFSKEHLYIDDIFEKIVKKKHFKKTNRRAIYFFFCTRARFRLGLKRIARSTLIEMSNEKRQELVCHFCGKQYLFSQEEIKELTGLS